MLKKDASDFIGKIGIAEVQNCLHSKYLNDGIRFLINVQRSEPNWGLPELVMPSFEEVMKKSAKSFYNIDHQLFQEFYKENEC